MINFIFPGRMMFYVKKRGFKILESAFILVDIQGLFGLLIVSQAVAGQLTCNEERAFVFRTLIPSINRIISSGVSIEPEPIEQAFNKKFLFSPPKYFYTNSNVTGKKYSYSKEVFNVSRNDIFQLLDEVIVFKLKDDNVVIKYFTTALKTMIDGDCVAIKSDQFSELLLKSHIADIKKQDLTTDAVEQYSWVRYYQPSDKRNHWISVKWQSDSVNIIKITEYNSDVSPLEFDYEEN